MEKFHMFDDRIYQMTNGVKAADRIIYTVMLNEQKFYHDKGQYYTPSYAHLGQYAGITRTTVIACMKRLEAHGLIKKTNVASNQCVIKVYSLDEVPEVLTELTAKEARKAKLESKVTQSVKKDDPLSQNSLPTESKFFTQSVKIFDTYNNSNNKKELINNNKEDDFLSLDELNDFLSMNESDLDSEATKEASKTSDLEEDKISDVNVDSDHKNTQCPATDDEMDPFDDYLDEESELTAKEARKAKLESKVTQSVKKDDPLSQNSLPTESKFFTQSVKIFDTYNNSNNKKELINNNKEDDFLSLDELNDFLSMNESDLDSEATKEASKTSDLEEDKISDVNVDSDHKNTQCPATDDEMDPFDDYLDEESEREEAIKKAQRKAEIKSRIEMAKLKNKVNDLDDFDDGDDDDFSFTPKKKVVSENKKQRIKPKMYYAGGGIQ